LVALLSLGYANLGHDYSSNGRGYGNNNAKSWLTGTYNWNHRSEGGSHGMVYEVFYINK